jgi:hypothetical protein
MRPQIDLDREVLIHQHAGVLGRLEAPGFARVEQPGLGFEGDPLERDPGRERTVDRCETTGHRFGEPARARHARLPGASGGVPRGFDDRGEIRRGQRCARSDGHEVPLDHRAGAIEHGDGEGEYRASARREAQPRSVPDAGEERTRRFAVRAPSRGQLPAPLQPSRDAACLAAPHPADRH